MHCFLKNHFEACQNASVRIRGLNGFRASTVDLHDGKAPTCHQIAYGVEADVKTAKIKCWHVTCNGVDSQCKFRCDMRLTHAITAANTGRTNGGKAHHLCNGRYSIGVVTGFMAW